MYYINVGLTYCTIGFAAAVFFYFVLRKAILGNFLGALIVGFIGSFFGGLLNYVFVDAIRILSDFNSVNIFAALFVSLLLIWIFHRVSPHK